MCYLKIINTVFEKWCKAKTNKCYVSKLVTDWKTWPKCGFLRVFFFFFFFSWAADMSDLSRSQLWNMELDFWMNKIQDTWRQNTELKKSVVQSVSLCLLYLFLYILMSKFIKNWKKKLSKQKKIKPWILLNQTRAEKQMRAAALRHRIFFFLA